MDALIALAGVAVVLVVLVDVFQVVILPRPIIGNRVGIARAVIAWTWRPWRAYCLRQAPAPRERRLALYAPLVLVLLLVIWLASLITGYGLVLYAIRSDVRPILGDFWTALYFAATSLLTIGFGDLIAVSAPARLVAIVAAGTGLVLVALSITFVFSLYAFFQRRELLVTTLDERAGARRPASRSSRRTRNWA